MRHTLVTLAVMLSIATLATPANAHHSHPYFYDGCRSITIEGRIERAEFKDPHSILVLRLDDGTAYTVDWAPLSRLTSQRIIEPARVALVPGPRVVVTGNLIRTAAEIRAKFPDFKAEVDPNTIDPRSIRRVDESVNWAPFPGAEMSPANCGQK